MARVLRADVVGVGDIGLLPVSQDAAFEGLWRLVDAAYEKRSVAICWNLRPAFDELMPKTHAEATDNRLLHHATSRHLLPRSPVALMISGTR